MHAKENLLKQDTFAGNVYIPLYSQVRPDMILCLDIQQTEQKKGEEYCSRDKICTTARAIYRPKMMMMISLEIAVFGIRS